MFVKNYSLVPIQKQGESQFKKRNIKKKNRMYRAIRAINKPYLSNDGISEILIPKEDGKL